MVQRRVLRFDNWEEVSADLRMLMESGYATAGNWDLEQISKHLNDWVRFPIVGFPRQPLVIRVVAAVLRNTVGPGMFRKILKSGSMPAGNPTLNSTVYLRSDGAVSTNAGTTSTEKERAAVAALEKSIEQFKNHQGEIKPSPLFGSMDKASAERLQLIHMAHHLSFLVPRLRT